MHVIKQMSSSNHVVLTQTLHFKVLLEHIKKEEHFFYFISKEAKPQQS